MFGGASTAAARYEEVFLFVAVLSVLFLVGVTGVMIYFLVRYRRRPGVKAQDIEGNVTLEITWTLVPLALFLAMFYYGWTNYAYMRSVPRDAMVIKVTARQWAYSFTYPDGRQTTELILGVGRPYKFELESLDVIHGFYIPAFRIKEDVVPGRHNYTWAEPTELGTFDLECTVICGVNHSYMLAKVHVLTEDAFKAWYFALPGEQVAVLGKAETSMAPSPAVGAQRFKLKGCVACHSDDGSPLIGPTLKGVYGRQVTVVDAGHERVATVDDAFIANKIRHPATNVLSGYRPEMTALELDDQDIAQIVAYLKTLR
jgi:cytochrome c oxidase subunit 2